MLALFSILLWLGFPGLLCSSGPPQRVRVPVGTLPGRGPSERPLPWEVSMLCVAYSGGATRGPPRHLTTAIALPPPGQRVRGLGRCR